MKTYRYEHLGFEISLPEEWHEAMSQQHESEKNRSVQFQSDDAKKRSINIVVGGLYKSESEPTLAETRSFFQGYVKRHNYSQPSDGSLQIQGREFFWGQYITPQGIMLRKYSTTVNRVEYLITCQYGLDSTSSERDIRRAEREYDEILSSFRISGTTTPESLSSVFIMDRSKAISRVITIVLISAVSILGVWLGWLVFPTWLTWVWTIVGGFLGSIVVFNETKNAGASCLVSSLVAIIILAGWISILFAIV